MAVVLLLIGCAVAFYRLAPGFPTSVASPSALPSSSASPAPTTVDASSATSSSASPAPTTGDTQSATPGGVSSTSGSAEAKTIQLEASAGSAKPFQSVRIHGTYRGGADCFLRVERWEGGIWVAFPVPAKTDQWGQFTAYVELGRPGRYRLRVLDPESGVKSKPFVLVIKR